MKCPNKTEKNILKNKIKIFRNLIQYVQKLMIFYFFLKTIYLSLDEKF